MGEHTEGTQEKEAVVSSHLWLHFIGSGQAFVTLSLNLYSSLPHSGFWKFNECIFIKHFQIKNKYAKNCYTAKQIQHPSAALPKAAKLLFYQTERGKVWEKVFFWGIPRLLCLNHRFLLVYIFLCWSQKPCLRGELSYCGQTSRFSFCFQLAVFGRKGKRNSSWYIVWKL